MIHAYDEYYLDQTQQKLAVMFELAVNYEKLSIDEFANLFLKSKVCNAFEKADAVYVLGKSANELLGIILNKAPLEIEQSMSCSPEYWVGHVLAYIQWYFNKSYTELFKVFPCSELVLSYFPYHEMDITKTVELFEKRLPKYNVIKELRKKCGLKQSELSMITGISLSTIKAYEQGTLDITKAQADTLVVLARVLHCNIEDLLKW